MPDADYGAPLRALRFAQARAVTERARGRADEERDWLDMCALLEVGVCEHLDPDGCGCDR